MAEWKYNDPGVTYNQVGLKYNFLSGVIAVLDFFIPMRRRRRMR